jgi:hypothetical protein
MRQWTWHDHGTTVDRVDLVRVSIIVYLPSYFLELRGSPFEKNPVVWVACDKLMSALSFKPGHPGYRLGLPPPFYVISAQASDNVNDRRAPDSTWPLI